MLKEREDRFDGADKAAHKAAESASAHKIARRYIGKMNNQYQDLNFELANCCGGF